MGWDKSFLSSHSSFSTAVPAADIPGDRDLCGIPQKRRTNTKQAWESRGQQGTSAILTLSYYHFRLS